MRNLCATHDLGFQCRSDTLAFARPFAGVFFQLTLRQPHFSPFATTTHATERKRVIAERHRAGEAIACIQSHQNHAFAAIIESLRFVDREHQQLALFRNCCHQTSLDGIVNIGAD